MTDTMIPVQVRITRKIVGDIDRLVIAGIYSSRSEFIRDAARRHLAENFR
jgi:Arc/MetJ-type ribon-helix-helix transcriptional regulator